MTPRQIKMTNNIHETGGIPYFMWDYHLTNKEIRDILDGEDCPQKIWLMAKIMRDARFSDIWQLLSMEMIRENVRNLRNRLGRRKRIWDFLLERYEKYGLA
jgi:predicted DNA-binding protein (UPF0278 family)